MRKYWTPPRHSLGLELMPTILRLIAPFQCAMHWCLIIKTNDPVRKILNGGLAITLIALMPILLLTAAGFYIFFNDFGLTLIWPVVCVVAWFLNRQGTVWGAALMVIVAAFGSVAIVSPHSYLDREWVIVDAIFVFPMIIAALFISPRVTIIAYLLEVTVLTGGLLTNYVTQDQVYSFLVSVVSILGLIAVMLAFGSSIFVGALQRSIRANQELMRAYDISLEGWSRALDLRDKETNGHSRRVTDMTLELARAIGLPEEQLIQVRRGALLHDIGKLGVPDAILFKPGRLSDEEWAIMQRHTEYAHELLSPIEHLRPALDIPYCHHEKWDGTGYPRGLSGTQIPLAARIFAVVDVWDALRSDRPYRKGWPDEHVHAYIAELSGSHFDPQVVQVFLCIMENDRK